MVNEIKKYLKYYNMPLAELLDKAEKCTIENFGSRIELCSLISAKTGRCEENCKYCSQSSHYLTDIHTHPLVSIEEVIAAAKHARESGATRFAIVTSGKSPDKDFDKLLTMIKEINKIEGLTSCASIGIINEAQAKALKEAGLTRFHHNINTSESNYANICTTHSYQDRINTVKLVQKYGMEVCCGVIIGMGESLEQRIEAAIEIRDLGVECAPINILTPIRHTPLEHYGDKITEEDIIRTIATFRLIMPKIVLRYAGGRMDRLSEENRRLGIKAGINAVLIGNMLTTTGIKPQDDLITLKELGKKICSAI
ncbi:MAG: biotin synthase BioB [Candidatus Gastranaerophilales bacterium]|nr:biotin synthase BioB [Candidatus Gastranaerophilales bacterium]